MNFSLLKKILAFQQKPTDHFPHFRPGDKVRVHWLVSQTKKARIQIFEGIVLAKKGILNTKNFIVRKLSSGFYVERTFFLNSPNLKKIELLSRGKVRRSKLYYLRNLRGKAARIKEIK